MTTLPQLVCASANPDKVAEMSGLLAGVVDLLPRPPEVPDVVEDADTLVGNARLKASRDREMRPDCRRWPTTRASKWRRSPGAPGCVPGVTRGRGAPTRTTGARCWPNSTVLPTVEPRLRPSPWCVGPTAASSPSRASVRARLQRPSTAMGDFGYDSIFVPSEGGGATFSQLDAAAKHAISHRGRAFRSLLEALSSPQA